ncbi:enoyl-CoA hydratase/isomerase family protein [Cryptosporangium aurantiacum]|uniref:2-(1,2-epoxy-1,2-dihydrophenyl)acetyl-CoA isomerase n=1 Tax=Cryptosporangium aurantiacum TaxID=134849 RepID=A0A1M7R4X5_9ACTN|nr:enoyl-CoA hydratase/isomerase family protein [Cryptosporangium aurantiacum]SHN40071.1 2-(1,2-epoxy-1,2-dihydrophenyl)acetyl-CoA isomerase [Cryptosporangium aurantiacum]
MSIRIEESAAAVVVTLSWPETRNAIGPDEADELAGAVRDAGERARGAVVLTGEGVFCSGGHLPVIAELSRTHTQEQIRETVYGRFQGMIRALRECPVPTVAAVDGAAIGLGLDLALACDVRLVGEKGWVQQGWARAGLVAGTGGVGLLGRIRPGLLWELLSTGDRIGPGDCDRLGIATAVEGTAREAAVERANVFGALPRDVLGHYVRLDRDATWPPDAHFAESARIQSGLIASDRFREFAQRVLGGAATRGGNRP